MEGVIKMNKQNLIKKMDKYDRWMFYLVIATGSSILLTGAYIDDKIGMLFGFIIVVTSFFIPVLAVIQQILYELKNIEDKNE